MSNYKSLSIQDLEEGPERGSIWVVNNAHRSFIELEGEVIINIPNAQGKADAMKVPQSWLPFEATARFPKRRVLESSDFRSAVNNELVIIISEEDAALSLREDGAREERQRLRALDQHIRAAGAPRKISDANVDIVNPNQLNKGNVVPVEVMGQREESVAAQIKAGAQPNADGLKPNFMAFFEKMKTQDDVTALNAMKNKGRFSRRELRYLRDNLPNHPKTVKTIKGRLVDWKKDNPVATAE